MLSVNLLCPLFSSSSYLTGESLGSLNSCFKVRIWGESSVLSTSAHSDLEPQTFLKGQNSQVQKYQSLMDWALNINHNNKRQVKLTVDILWCSAVVERAFDKILQDCGCLFSHLKDARVRQQRPSYSKASEWGPEDGGYLHDLDRQTTHRQNHPRYWWQQGLLIYHLLANWQL